MRMLAAIVVILGTALAAAGARGDAYVGEVHREAAVAIAAGLAGGGRVIHFGDALELVVIVDYDPDRLSIADLDESLFESAWSASDGVYLRSVAFERDSMPGPFSARLRASYEFQLLGCPDADRPTCAGDRVYLVPEFELGYTDVDTGTAGSIGFQPEPQTLTVMTTIQLDAENQLFPFQVYFPNGGYPEPATGTDGRRTAFATAGVALALLTGGLIMWPFRSRNDNQAAAAIPRWRTELQALQGADATDNARYLDNLRRCLVWYCNDELGVDAFIWLDLAERGDESRNAAEDDHSLDGLRELFVDLLHEPPGEGAELRARFEQLIATRGHAPA